jgi:hypothetical protein
LNELLTTPGNNIDSFDHNGFISSRLIYKAQFFQKNIQSGPFEVWEVRIIIYSCQDGIQSRWLVLEVKFMYFSSYATSNEVVVFHLPAVASCTSAPPFFVGRCKRTPCSLTSYVEDHIFACASSCCRFSSKPAYNSWTISQKHTVKIDTKRAQTDTSTSSRKTFAQHCIRFVYDVPTRYRLLL